MRPTRRTFLRLTRTAGATAIARFASTCANAQTVVKIGVINSLSGFLGPPGDEMQKGMDLYTKLHRSDLPAGVGIELVVRDDTSNPEVGKRLAPTSGSQCD